MDYDKKIYNLLHVCESIVSYKTAAAELGINYNEAKDVLKKYVSGVGKNDIKAVTYLVGGITFSGLNKVLLVSDDKYEKAKKLFKKISIDHIHSIQVIPIDWYLFNVIDEFMLSDEKVLTDQVKEESKTSSEEEPANNMKALKNHIKQKGSISSFFSQHNPLIQNCNKIKREEENSQPKSDNQTKISPSCNSSMRDCIVKLEKFDFKTEKDDGKKIITETRRKRARVLSDDEDDEIISKKSQKADILDDNSDNEDSSSDIFGDPEESDEKTKTEENTPEDSAEKECKSSNSSEKESQASTISDNMYEDSDGYFVTERKPNAAKRKNYKPVNQVKEIKREVVEEKSTQKEKTKEPPSKRKKNNTNQKTLFNFFNKK